MSNSNTQIYTARISNDPEFQMRLDDEDPFICPVERLQSLIDEAPDEYSQGFLAGVYSFRQQLAAVTGRSC